MANDVGSTPSRRQTTRLSVEMCGADVGWCLRDPTAVHMQVLQHEAQIPDDLLLNLLVLGHHVEGVDGVVGVQRQQIGVYAVAAEHDIRSRDVDRGAIRLA
eukprot:scaffold1019_cov255-Pinguiococcus_pyrenoidosus.AAC.22